MMTTKTHPISALAATADGAVIEHNPATEALYIPQTDPKDLYTAALAYSPFGIAFLNEFGDLIQLNRTLCQWMDCSVHHVEKTSFLDLIEEEDRPLVARALQRTLKNGQAYHDIELRLTAQDSPQRWVSVTLNRLPVTEGQQVVVFMSDITRRKKTETELLHLANTDHLTGLSNRMVFEETLHRAVKNARRYDRQGAVLYIDLNDFKGINDTYGHKAGDAILQEVGRVLNNTFRETDTVARIGGDEFAVIMEEVVPSQAHFKGKAVERAVKKICIDAHEQRVCCTASVGVQVFSGAGTRAEDILSAADQAMYHHKSTQKSSLNG